MRANQLVHRSPWLALVLSLMLIILVANAPASNASITNTRLDAWGTTELGGGSWLSGGGVDVYSNGSTATGPSPDSYNYVNNSSGQSTQSGIKWQCVELVNRLYLEKGWITSRWTGNANQMYGTAPSGLSKESQSSITYVNPGDVVVLDDGSFGHVGIVDSISDNGNGTKTVHTVNQNTQAVRMDATWNVAGKTLSSYLAGYSVTGVVHAPISSSGVVGGRMVLVNSGGWLFAKDAITGPWNDQSAQVTSVAVGGNRMALIDGAGQVWAKDSLSYGGWSNQGAVATSVAVGSTGRMMIIIPGGGVWAKDSLSYGGWTDEGATATQIAVGGNRMALVNSGGWLFAKDAITGPWNDQSAQVTSVAVGSTGRMMIITPGGGVWAKDSLSYGGWTDEGATALSIQVS